MSLADKMMSDERLRWASAICALNALTVITVAVWGRWGSSEEPSTGGPPAVELPVADAPVDAEKNHAVGNADPTREKADVQVEPPEIPALGTSLGTSGTPSAHSDFVLDEIRKAISNDPELSVPSFSYPALERALPIPGQEARTRAQDVRDLAMVAQRTAVLHQLTAASVELVREAELQARVGNPAQVESLMSELSVLRSLIARLARAHVESSSAPPASGPVPSTPSP